MMSDEFSGCDPVGNHAWMRKMTILGLQAWREPNRKRSRPRCILQWMVLCVQKP